MEYVVFRPYWSPPPASSKRRSSPTPAAIRDTSAARTWRSWPVAATTPALPGTPENLDAVVAGRLYVRQKPGPQNSLGLAKFIFPNADNIYMHGTPAQQLFSRTRRDFSHGCIRLE